MSSLQQQIASFIVHQYESKEIKGKLVEVAFYSLDASDIKFRIVKFIDNTFKEIYTTEEKEKALEKFEELLRKP